MENKPNREKPDCKMEKVCYNITIRTSWAYCGWEATSTSGVFASQVSQHFRFLSLPHSLATFFLFKFLSPPTQTVQADKRSPS